jgi:polysaccharide chain length determinant protein (PEP-CTERM system associated)
MNQEFDEIFSLVLKECYTRRNLLVAIFVIVSLTVLAVGTVWPKKYTASVLIEVDTANILQPLMQGRAETTKPVDHVANAREIVFSDENMEAILQHELWIDDYTTEKDAERLKERIKEKVNINRFGKNLIRMEFQDSDALRSFETLNMMVDFFIARGEQAKINESQSAFDFITKQVDDYLQKLIEVEDGIKNFRSENPDVRPGLITEVSNKISKLKDQIETTDLEIRETRIKHDSIKEQLSGEALIAISQTKEGQYLSKIAELQNEVDTLKLDYTDTYPDIIRLNNQIEELKVELKNEIERRKAVISSSKQNGETYIDESMKISPLYQELRSNLSNTETKIATLKTRRNELNKMLENEYARAAQIHKAEAKLSDLTRNYQVNQDIYQDLLKRRENARVSKTLDQEHQGLTFKIQEPAKIPLIPTGLRFLHFLMIGPLLGLSLSIGLVYMFIQFDPRVRSSKSIINELNIPVLAEINQFKSPSQISAEKKNVILLAGVLAITGFVYIYTGIVKYLGAL